MSGPENRWAFAVCKDKLGKDGNIECGGIIELRKLIHRIPDVMEWQWKYQKGGSFYSKMCFFPFIKWPIFNVKFDVTVLECPHSFDVSVFDFTTFDVTGYSI